VGFTSEERIEMHVSFLKRLRIVYDARQLWSEVRSSDSRPPSLANHAKAHEIAGVNLVPGRCSKSGREGDPTRDGGWRILINQIQ
jgi:hypothetical protein